MHFGDYRRDGTQTNQLFRLLFDMRPHTPPEIARELGTTNPTTIVSALRIALDNEGERGAPWILPFAKSERGDDGRIRHFYQLELRIRLLVNLELFEIDEVEEMEAAGMKL